MKHGHHGGFDRDPTLPETDARHRPDHPHARPHRGGRHGGGRHGGRVFDYGELRLLLLAMLAEAPRHGYELIKVIEERFAGSYTPSPGVIYPTLSWLEDMGYASVEAEAGNRKLYRVTEEGGAFLAANRSAADELIARGAAEGPGPRGGRPDLPAPILRAMENLKLAMRLRLRQGPLDPQTAETIAAALDAAAQTVERSR
ncbi:PadR family transcriptional regulator [Aurantimonas sp. Leaf443]|uniref:PadR family transcriptional regulator n=1 Tax=Aurantimonas sp. Leaf443 TaxID=1736378 RepID=UPI0006F65D87|nr:PadR family transcriptional regulator [Aurantimonas sp. Leaf443]KQT82790.1 PadR family transcriptional regulator [Aurantimonas sp. Leaf443]